MKRLFLTAFRSHAHRFLLFFTLISMCCLTVASQMEIFALGVITKKGPDFFDVMASKEVPGQITKIDFEQHWQQLDPNHQGYITKKEVSAYLARKNGEDIVSKALSFGNRFFAISDNFSHLAIFLVCVAFFKAIALFSQRFSTRLISIRVSKDLRQDYFKYIQSMPMSFYQKHDIGSLSSRVVGDASLIAEALNACLVNYIQTPFVVLSTLLLCFATSWELSLIVFLGFPLIICPIVFLAKRVKRISKQIQSKQEKFVSALIDFLAGIQTVKVFAMEEFSLKKYQEQNEAMAALEQKSARYDLATRPIVHTIGMAFLAVTLMYGLYVLHMSVADVLVYCGFLYLFYEPVKKFAEENTHIQRGISAAERMYEVMHLKPEIEDHPTATQVREFKDKIEFAGVWFRYGDTWTIKNLNLTIRKGEKVAIVGPTGGGKSTIAQLLPRLYDVQQGEIRIDGQSIKEITQRSLREMIAFVPQKPFLFLDTVAQNIAYGNPYSAQQISLAARQAHAEEFILKLSKGYETELAEGGKNLSGGQQQRLAIARALVKDAPILVMDEATSSLDTVSEYQIKLAIQQLRGKITQIIIAHRLTTIEDADRIVYVEKGEKVAEGTKEQLLQNCSGFRAMWEMMHKQNISA